MSAALAAVAVLLAVGGVIWLTGWSLAFADYLHPSFNTAMAFRTTDVSAMKP